MLVSSPASRLPDPPTAALSAAAAAVIAAALAAAPDAARAEPAPSGTEEPVVACSERGRMVGHLAEAYGETLRGAGLRGASGIVELYVSESGSWTLLLTLPTGESCPVAVGDDWRMQSLGGGAPT